MSGSPRPPLDDTVKCVLAVAGFAVLQSDNSKYGIIGPDAAYFSVGKEYSVAFTPLGPGNAVGGSGEVSAPA